ncbi:MAG: phenylalanine--tRNA ligase subunit beta [Candidatus Wallbacteria bacterium]|nr:phenylalanine--tRNA ligase subunit beta [Candidatus Wallbacteria bacterium]
MKLSWQWLRDLADLDTLTPEEVFNRFTLHSAELESIENEAEFLSRVITVKITAVRPHPDADKLRLVTVDTGAETLEIVCGAPNVEAGKVGVLARIGTTLPGGFTLTPKKIRGVTSEGMLCSERELGLSDSHEGIIILPGETPCGKPYSDITGKNDAIFELDNKSITHRPDLWGHLGIAREVCALFGRQLRNPYQRELSKSATCSQMLEIDNRVPDMCPRYCAAVISGLSVCESPEWIKKRLTAVGSRPINNIVDATNFVMLELGQPLHAFDRRQLNGNTIVIRLGSESEQVVTLDNAQLNLSGSEIVIADKSRAVALGGVMGLANSGVGPDTREIVLESANFDPASIRRTANRFNLRTDAAQRFEKSQDPENAPRAMQRFLELIRETCPDAEFSSPVCDNYPGRKASVSIDASFDFFRRRLGTDIANQEICRILESLEFRTMEKDGGISVTVPSFRSTKDITQSIDLVEEVGRIFGYDNIAPVSPSIAMDIPPKDEMSILIRRIRETLSSGLGYTEIYNYSFYNEAKAQMTALDTAGAVKMRNPLSQEADMLVTDLLPNMLESVRNNSRFNDEFSFYEIGHVFEKDTDRETLIAARYIKNPGTSQAALTLKYNMEELLNTLGYDSSVSPEAIDPRLHPFRSGIIRTGKMRFPFGELKPEILKKWDIRGRVAVSWFFLRELLGSKTRSAAFRELPKFPAVPFDLTILIPEQAHVTSPIREMKKTAPGMIEEIGFVGFYQDEKFASGMKAATFHVVFRSADHTLSGEERTQLEQGLIKRMQELGYPLR